MIQSGFLIGCFPVEKKEQKETRRKVLEAIGCLLYLAAAVILTAVFFAHCGQIFN